MDSLNKLNKILLQGKRVLVRGDLDVPVQDGVITDPSRLEAMRETLDYLVLRNVKVILMGHLGRPEGKIVEELRLTPIAEYLTSLGYDVIKLNVALGTELYQTLKVMEDGTILLLENLRFDPREEKNDENFAKDIASFGDLYVNECFATSHREHASISQVPKFLDAYSGFRLERESENINKVISNYETPLVAVFGGIKLETKLPVISKFLKISDFVLLGGRLGINYETDNNYKILVPIDYLGDKEDIGPKTVKMFSNVIDTAKTVIWNGPMGKIEDDAYLSGTKEIAEAIINSKAFSLVGGGDTIEALNKLKITDKMSFVSMGGGAMLEYISGNKLPGLLALNFYE